MVGVALGWGVRLGLFSQGCIKQYKCIERFTAISRGGGGGGAKGPTPRTAMYTVCCTIELIWGLRVLCPCRDKDPNLVCHGDCMGPTVRCMGVSIYVSPSCTFAHAHPNALDANWQLKFGAPLQSHWATTTRRTTNVLLSALSNVLPFVHSWGSFLLLVTGWMQLAFLAGYLALAVCASAIAAVHRVLARTQWDVPMSLRWVTFISSRLPQSLGDTVSDLLAWLHKSVAWQGRLYASWHISHLGPCTDFCADWSTDLLALQGLLSLLSSHPQVDWGVHRGRGVTAATI